VADALVSGELRLHGWVYDIGTGQVQVYEEAQRRFVPLRGETGAGVPVAGCACAACEVAAMAQ
jgi:carbonic anhydrase